MHSRPHTFSGFVSLFIILPLLSAVAFSLVITGFSSENIQNIAGMDEFSSFAQELRADVFPRSNERPDGNLPIGKVESDFIPAIIDIMLALSSTVVLGICLTSGYLYITHFGDEERLKTAKVLLKWGLAGVIIVIVAYSIIEGVINFNFSRSLPS